MRTKTFSNLNPEISDYIKELHGSIEGDDLALALKNARQQGTPPLQIYPTDGRHLEVLARSLKPSKIVEIGTLCGYSALILARALTKEGVLYTCELSPHHAQAAQKTFDELNLTNTIKIILGPALQTLPTLNHLGPFDLIFIDADKINYVEYLKWAKANIRQGGMIIADNVFAMGHIANKNLTEGNELKKIVLTLQEFNKQC
ncbi:MAG: O-methyltransferase, partial [Silvanigrellaceae bacterium]|nr:O-methyltransferase [Silvanigrellaceae bacterium]